MTSENSNGNGRKLINLQTIATAIILALLTFFAATAMTNKSVSAKNEQTNEVQCDQITENKESIKDLKKTDDELKEKDAKMTTDIEVLKANHQAILKNTDAILSKLDKMSRNK